MRLLLSIEYDQVLADVPDRPGSPPVGRGDTLYEALGNWLVNNQTELGIKIDVDPTAWPLELERRRKELAER